ENRRAQAGDLLAGERDGGWDRSHPLICDVATDVQNHWRARVAGLAVIARACVGAFEQNRPAAVALFAQAGGVQFGEDERRPGESHAEPLHGCSNAPGGGPEIFAPIAARPHLIPVGDHRWATERAGETRGDQREVWKAAGVHDVEVAPMAQQVPKDAPPEGQRRCDPAAARAAVQLPPAAHRNAAHAGWQLELRAALPLAAG